MLRHLIIGPGPCIFEILKYRMFLESVCVGKQEFGLVSDPSSKGHEIPPSSSINTTLRASFRLWILFRLKVRHSCNFAYFVCVQRPDQDRLRIPTFINTSSYIRNIQIAILVSCLFFVCMQETDLRGQVDHALACSITSRSWFSNC